MHHFGILILLILFSMPVGGYGQDSQGDHFNPSDMVIDKDESFYLSCADNNEIRKFSSSGQLLARQSLKSSPQNIVLTPNHKSLVVASGQDTGELTLLEARSLKPILSLRCGHSPQALQFSPDGSQLALAQRFKDEVWLLETTNWTVTQKFSVLRQPIDIKWRNDHTLVILHHLSHRSADSDWTGCSITQIDVSTAKSTVIPLSDGSSGARKMALSADGKIAFAPMVIGSFRVPATQIERGWINKNGLSVVDLENNVLLGTLLLDDINLGAANPWDIQLTPKEAWISLAGVHQLMVVDVPLMMQNLSTMSSSQRENLTYDLNIGRTWKRRINLDGKGPRALVISQDRGYGLVASAFSSSVEKFYIDTKAISSILSPQDLAPSRKGEFLFHDARISFQQWMSCASCHPDARTDGLNWDLENDGLGSPRQVKSMLFTHFTPPTTITGIRPDAETSVRKGMIFLRAPISEENAMAIDTYLKKLLPVPSPYLKDDGSLSPAAMVGKEIFEGKANCFKCHNGEYFTNQKLRHVGTGLGDEKDQKFDVPSLREIWRTAPYLNDGRAATLESIFLEFNPNQLHGGAHTLSPTEFQQLMAYLKSI